MKVLFAVNNEKISESIINRYQKDYKEIISSKNVYYFNAIIKELQKDKSYDRIVISEDLEPFSNEDHETIDKFIFDKLDKISDEAYSVVGNDIPIILICEDRRRRPEPILVKIFGIGVYNALVGQDRSIDQVCELLNKPRSKKEAKRYYKIDSEKVEYKPENESDVSEDEIQNILSHYKRLGKNEEKYIKSFDSIAAQYNDEQLKLIITFLPKDVINVLERRSSRYRQVVGLNPRAGRSKRGDTLTNRKFSQPKIEVMNKPMVSNMLNSPVIIPNAVDSNKVKRVIRKAYTAEDILEKPVKKVSNPTVKLVEKNDEKLAVRKKTKSIKEETENQIEKKGRGRPPKTKEIQEENPRTTKRGRGRPPKNKSAEEIVETVPKATRRGRPTKKNEEEINRIENNEDDDIFLTMEDDEDNNVLIDFEEMDNVEPVQEYIDDDEENVLPGNEEDDDEEEFELPDIEEDDDEEEFELSDIEEENEEEESDNDYELPGFEDDEFDDEYDDVYEDDEENVDDYGYIEETGNFGGEIKNVNFNGINSGNDSNGIEQVSHINPQMNVNIDNLLSSDRKIVSFVGTSKNGTSFLINNLAEMISEKGIRTAILDLTQNRNAYYVYTDNRDELRNIAYRCIENLRRGVAEGIEVNRNLTVYTSLPDDIEGLKDANSIIETLLNNYSLVLLDCDFMTELPYFNIAQEIYLVQSLDVLTIQPLTAFLREIKAKNMLDPNKLRVVINKYVKSQITQKMLIGGMSSYNDPSMSYMTELFDRDKIKCLTIPFEIQNYSKYLESLVDCRISVKGYSKTLMNSLGELENSVFPLIYNSKGNNSNNYNNYFSKSTNNNLNKMKKKY